MKRNFIRLFFMLISTILLVHLSYGAESIVSLTEKNAQGDAQAQMDLGTAYYKGEGVAQDEAEATKWFRLAADQGLAQAQYKLGFLLMKGEGVAQDRVEATKWFRLAADQGLRKPNISWVFYS